MNKSIFDQLVDLLRHEHRYVVDVQIHPEKGYRWARVGGYNIRACFAEPSDDSKAWVINNHICAEREDLFVNLRDCSLRVAIPTTREEKNELIKRLKELGRASNG